MLSIFSYLLNKTGRKYVIHTGFAPNALFSIQVFLQHSYCQGWYQTNFSYGLQVKSIASKIFTFWKEWSIFLAYWLHIYWGTMSTNLEDTPKKLIIVPSFSKTSWNHHFSLQLEVKLVLDSARFDDHLGHKRAFLGCTARAAQCSYNSGYCCIILNHLCNLLEITESVCQDYYKSSNHSNWTNGSFIYRSPCFVTQIVQIFM